MFKALVALALAGTLHSPAYVLSGHPSLGHGSETVAVRMAPGLRDVTVYAEPASGDYEAFAPTRWNARTHRYTARFTFTRQDETGTWYVTSTTGWTRTGHLVQITSPDPSFTVRS